MRAAGIQYVTPLLQGALERVLLERGPCIGPDRKPLEAPTSSALLAHCPLAHCLPSAPSSVAAASGATTRSRARRWPQQWPACCLCCTATPLTRVRFVFNF